jgi:hypothetical protein
VNGTAFETITMWCGRVTSRRSFVGRLVKAGAAVAAVATVGLPRSRSAVAQACPYGPSTCMAGYVWRNAYNGDVVCVDPSQRDQAAADNAATAARVDPNGLSGPLSCQPSYVWRNAYNGDAVCVEPWVRDQVAYDNSQAAARIEPGCISANGGAVGIGDTGCCTDSDGDGLVDGEERYTYGTDPYDPDTDHDGWGDSLEISGCVGDGIPGNPLDPNDHPPCIH